MRGGGLSIFVGALLVGAGLAALGDVLRNPTGTKVAGQQVRGFTGQLFNASGGYKV